MSQELKKEYLKAIRERYRNSAKVRKSVILNEFCSVCGYSRKYAIAILNGQIEPLLKKPRGRSVKYSGEIIYHLVRLWNIMGRPCSIKFKTALPEWIDHDPDPILRENDCYRSLVLSISRSHLDRVLRPYRVNEKGFTSTRPAIKRFKSQIPIEPRDWNVTGPGHTQGDTVAHCGNALQGGFANSLTVTDIHTAWTEVRALWGKGAIRVTEAMRSIEEALPFTLISFKSDSGTEFLNEVVFSYFRKERSGAPVELKRSRPYKKDDNCYVEQKNFTHVREIFGYERIGQSALVQLMNEIYRDLWCPLQNFFIPSMKLLRKSRIGARIKKEYDLPKTPYQRLMECPQISEEQKAKLRERKARLNPFRLQEELERKLQTFQEELRRQNTGRLAQAA